MSAVTAIYHIVIKWNDYRLTCVSFAGSSQQLSSHTSGSAYWPSTRPIAYVAISLRHAGLQPTRRRVSSSQGLWPCRGLRPQSAPPFIG